jgi:hypothetical protein
MPNKNNNASTLSNMSFSNNESNNNTKNYFNKRRTFKRAIGKRNVTKRIRFANHVNVSNKTNIKNLMKNKATAQHLTNLRESRKSIQNTTKPYFAPTRLNKKEAAVVGTLSAIHDPYDMHRAVDQMHILSPESKKRVKQHILSLYGRTDPFHRQRNPYNYWNKI